MLRDSLNYFIKIKKFGFFVAAVSALALAAAYTAQYGFGLQPCILCLYQRVPYAVVVALGALAFFGPPRIGRWALVFTAVAFAAGAAIAFFHVGVEHKWWEGTDGCKSTLDVTDLEALRAQIMGAKHVRCDEPTWFLFGFTMAFYNMLMSAGLAALNIAAIAHIWRTPEAGGA